MRKHQFTHFRKILQFSTRQCYYLSRQNITSGMYNSLQLPWSSTPSPSESAYRSAGLTKTKGTLFILPPPRSELEASFNTPPKAKSRMSAGAVALCKHFERSGGSSEHGRPHPFWTLPVGSNENKSAIAKRIVEEMLEDAVWRNVMLLHRDVAIYEVRNKRGYGMRWTLLLAKIDGLRRQGDNGSVGVQSGRNGESGLEQNADVNDDGVDTTIRENESATSYDGENWKIIKTTFRGFVEPIADMNHELM